MKLHIEQDASALETEITVRCHTLDEETLRIVALLRTFDAKLTGEKNGETCVLAAADVLYADTADKHTFLYTAAEVYQTPLRLYELAERLAPHGFVRAGKSAILNLNRVKSLRPDLGGRIRVTMQNGELINVSRQYVPEIKALLGI